MQYSSREVYEYISQQTNDPIVQRKVCALSGVEYAVYQSELDFYHTISPSFAGQKFAIPVPSLCPEERQRRRSACRNFFRLKKRTCAATGKGVISQYDEPYIVYDNAYRWSDSWDAGDFGQEYDSGMSFTQQWKRLSLAVPRYATHNLNCENSAYCNMAANSSNCYLVAGCIGNEDCMYGHILWQSQSCLDLVYSKRCQECYECVDCLDCVGCHYVKQCEQCSFCTGCIGLIGKSYCVFNQQYTKQQYEEIISQLGEDEIRSQMMSLQQTLQVAGCKLVQCDRVYGNDNTESSNLVQCYDAIQSEESRYLYTVGSCVNSMDVCYTGLGGEWLYDSLFPHGQRLYRTHNCQDNCYEIFYSENCYACDHCFGCIGLRNKSYCIFNKQYSQSEYEELVSKIIGRMMEAGEWGEFFGPSLSPFEYNQTIAQEYYPLTQQQAEQLGYKRSSYSSDPKIPDTAQVLRPGQMSHEDRADTVSNDDIIRQIIICESSGRPYMIQKAELEFYRKHKLSLPRKHPDLRHEQRMGLRSGRTLYLRECDDCTVKTLSVYESQVRVYCDTCHQAHI